ncbi:EAL domain-containing protein [Alicyclobacillus sp. TC]|nr:EAL domain-containing protein [Alicyclobacillus sp. TC]
MPRGGGGGYKLSNRPNIPTSVLQSILSSIQRGQLDVVFQPIVHHRKEHFFAYESLSRPQCEGKGIPPDVWFQAAYEYQLSTEIDRLALSMSLKKRLELPAKWQSKPIFVNVSPHSLTERAYLEELEHLLQESHCPPSQLIFEMIEYIAYDPKTLFEMLRPLRSLGVRIALDDMGVGHANLSTLVILEPDFIKIDRSLIQNIHLSDRKQRLLSHLLCYMDSGEQVIAEGVEKIEEVQITQQLGIDLSQGYYWARPMAVEDWAMMTPSTFLNTSYSIGGQVN